MIVPNTKQFFVSQRTLRWGLVITFIVHMAGGVLLATLGSMALKRSRFAGDNSITITVAMPRVEPHAPPEPIRFAPQLATAPIVVSPQEAIVAKSTFVQANHSMEPLETPKSINVPNVHQTRQRDVSQPTPAVQPPARRLPKRERLPTPRLTTTAELPKSVGNEPKTPPDFSRNPPPQYPAIAIQRGWEGEVWLRLKISRTGKVVNVGVVKSSGYAVLDAAAVNAVKRWRAKPAQQGGRDVDTTEILPVRFRRR